MKRKHLLWLLPVLLAGAFCLTASRAVRAADHEDSPMVDEDRAADITDIYAFLNPTDNTKLDLVLDTFPLIHPGENALFSPEVLYQLKIDNVGDAVEHLVIQVTFSPIANGSQTFSVYGPAAPTVTGSLSALLTGSPTVTGATGNTVSGGGLQVFAGLRDDPFFFDLPAFRLFFNAVVNKTTPVPAFPRNPGIDFFAGTNVEAIVIELPVSMLEGASKSPKLGIWGTTSRKVVTLRRPSGPSSLGNYMQVDRMGRPAINTVLIPAKDKDAFNLGTPATDVASFSADVSGNLAALGSPAALVGALLPDILTLDASKPTTYSTLNGRALADDVIAISLSVLTNGAIKTSGLSGNDASFLTTFPFLAPPHPVP